MPRPTLPPGLVLLGVAAGVTLLVRLAPAQTWSAGPCHGATAGVRDGSSATTTWDPDGAGPLPPSLVVGGDTGVRVWLNGAWSYLGGASLSSVHDVEVFNGSLYACGSFSRLGGDTVGGIARWDGSHWTALGGGLLPISNIPTDFGHLDVMHVHAGLLYIGGILKPAELGGQVNIAAWNGVAWVAVPATPTAVTDMIEYGADLVCSTTGYSGVAGVWRLGASQWVRIGPSMSGAVNALAVYNGELVIGGDFAEIYTPPTSVLVSRVARFTGTTWAPLGAGVAPSSAYDDVHALTVFGNLLVAGGHCASRDNQTVHNLAAWNGTSWSALATGLESSFGTNAPVVAELSVAGGDLLAMGAFDRCGPDSLLHLARWDANASEWLPFVEGVNGRVRTFLAAGTGLDVGGDFDFHWGAYTVHHLLSGDGTTFGALYTPGGFNGTNGPVTSLGLVPPRLVGVATLFVGGGFTQAGATSAVNEATYTVFGGDFGAAGAGLGNTVSAMAVLGRTAWAAGYFTNSGGTPLSHVAYYGTGGWTNPGPWSFPIVTALATYSGQLVIGGAANGGNGITFWNGTTMTVDANTDGPVNAFATFGGDLVAAGAFTAINGVPAAGVARRDAASGTWSAMGAGFTPGAPYALAVYDGSLYAGGTFQSTGALACPHLARWTGGAWTPVLGGLDGPVYALVPFGFDLHVGGEFSRAFGGPVSPDWIVYHDGVLAAEPPSEPRALRLADAAPNPARGNTRLAFTLPAAGRARLAVYDVEGRAVRTLADGAFAAGEHAFTWDGRDAAGRECAGGVYFERLVADGRALARSLVRLPH